MLYHAYNIVTGRVVGEFEHGKYVVGILNSTEKRLLTMLMETVKFPGTYAND